MGWKECGISRSQINKAGKTIIKADISTEERDKAMEIIGQYRAAHAYPLYVITNKLKRMVKDNYKGAFVVSRLKRLDSIVPKLERMPDMSLFGMQDIGGCRVVLNNIKQVYQIADEYEKSRIRHVMCKENDYLQNPKNSGYRSLHRVYKYVSDKKDSYNGMRIEIQFRTKLQHIWATAVETMGIYTRTNLKASKGGEEYLRFFALVSSLFAIKEGYPTVPDTSDDVNELIAEIKAIDKRCAVLAKLETIRKAVKVTELNGKTKMGYHLLELDLKNKGLRIESFTPGNIQKATDLYKLVESRKTDDIDVVLVTASSFDELKAAYPNYFGDVGQFIKLVRKEIQKEIER